MSDDKTVANGIRQASMLREASANRTLQKGQDIYVENILSSSDKLANAMRRILFEVVRCKDMGIKLDSF